MQNKWLAVLGCLLLPLLAAAQKTGPLASRKAVPLGSTGLSGPFILADAKTHQYYLTGTGGLLWKSSNLKAWARPYQVAQPDPTSWMGPKPMIWAAEIHS